jgi:hypothetical protein
MRASVVSTQLAVAHVMIWNNFRYTTAMLPWLAVELCHSGVRDEARLGLVHHCPSRQTRMPSSGGKSRGMSLEPNSSSWPLLGLPHTGCRAKYRGMGVGSKTTTSLGSLPLKNTKAVCFHHFFNQPSRPAQNSTGWSGTMHPYALVRAEKVFLFAVPFLAVLLFRSVFGHKMLSPAKKTQLRNDSFWARGSRVSPRKE